VEAPWLSRLVVVLIVFALFTLAEAQQPKIYRVGVILQGGPFYEQSSATESVKQEREAARHLQFNS